VVVVISITTMPMMMPSGIVRFLQRHEAGAARAQGHAHGDDALQDGGLVQRHVQ
jgi:hypothetical protein